MVWYVIFFNFFLQLLNEFARRVRREQESFLTDARQEYEKLIPVIAAYVNSQQSNKLLKEVAEEFQLTDSPSNGEVPVSH